MKAEPKKFDSVKWVREIRDKFYKSHKNLKGEDYLNAIRKSIRKEVLSSEKSRGVRRKTKQHV